MAKDEVEDAVVAKVLDDMQSAAFVQQLTADARRYAVSQPADPTQDLRQRLKELTQSISRMMDLAASLQDPAPALRKIEELEEQRKVVAADIASLEKEQGVNAGLATITESAVKQLLGGVVEEMRLMRRELLKDMLASLAEKVVLDPATLECQIHYRIGVDGRNRLASPRGFGVPELSVRQINGLALDRQT